LEEVAELVNITAGDVFKVFFGVEEILNETLSKMDLQGCLFLPNLSMSDGFKGKLRVSIYSHLSFEVWRLDITNLLLEADGLVSIKSKTFYLIFHCNQRCLDVKCHAGLHDSLIIYYG